MTAICRTPHVNSAFVPTAPFLRSQPQLLRRPRHGPAPCRCRPTHPRVRCTAGDERDQNVSATNKKKDTWFPNWKWPKAEDRGSVVQDDMRDEVREVSEEGEVRKEDAETDDDKVVQKTFKWPWQRDPKDVGAVETGAKNGVDDAKAAKKVRHSDSKPGANLTGKTSKEDERESTTWQEKWDGFVQAIATNMKKKTGSEDAHHPEEDMDKVSIAEAMGNEDEEDDPRGVPELYDKPRQNSERLTQSHPKAKDSKWFGGPWKRVPSDPPKTRKQESGPDADVKVSQRPGLKISKVEDTTLRDDGQPNVEEEVADIVAAVKSNTEESSDDEKNIRKPKEIEKEPAILVASKVTKVRMPSMDIISIPQKDVAAIRLIFGSETFFATETLSPPGGLIFRGNLRGEPKATLAKLEERLASRLGDKYTLCLAEGEEDLRPVVVVVPTARDKRPPTLRQRYIALVIAVMSITTVMTRGVYVAMYKPIIQNFYPLTSVSLFQKVFANPNAIAITVSAAVAVVIIISQIVQRVVASRHGTRIALPYFIPSVQLGTFGAVVQLASPTPTRAALFDIALSGAATLVSLALACLLIGLRLSTTFPTVVPVPMSTVSNSVVIGFLTQQIPNGQILVDYGRSLIGLHPLAVIGANCLTIAALNLLPIRQLDGGRIISALYGRRTAVVASRITVLFLLLASTKSPYFVVFLAAITFGPWHMDRPSKNEVTEPNALRVIVGYLFMLLMIGVLLPYPASKFFGTI